jgi:hypothetical protein
MPGEDKLLERTVSLLESKTSRQSFLVRFALGASAFAVGGVRFLVRPQSAMSTIALSCSDCSGSSACCTETTSCFCCTITGSNDCPTNSQRCGWWFCSSNGITYIDCCGGCGSSSFCCHAQCGNRPGCKFGREYFNCGCDFDPSCACNGNPTNVRCRITRRALPPNLACCGGTNPGGACTTPPACAAV